MNGFTRFTKWLLLSLIMLVAVLVVGFFLVQPAHAAPANPALLPAVHQTGDGLSPQEILERLLELLLNGTVVTALAPGIVVIVNILKLVLPNTLKANWISLVVQVVVWIVYWVASSAGRADQFQQIWMAGITIAGALLSLFTQDQAVKAIFNRGVKKNSLMFGYQRSDPNLIEPAEGKAVLPLGAWLREGRDR